MLYFRNMSLYDSVLYQFRRLTPHAADPHVGGVPLRGVMASKCLTKERRVVSTWLTQPGQPGQLAGMLPGRLGHVAGLASRGMSFWARWGALVWLGMAGYGWVRLWVAGYGWVRLWVAVAAGLPAHADAPVVFFKVFLRLAAFIPYFLLFCLGASPPEDQSPRL